MPETCSWVGHTSTPKVTLRKRAYRMADTLNVEQAAELLHLNVKRVQSLARDGKLPGVPRRPEVAVPARRARARCSAATRRRRRGPRSRSARATDCAGRSSQLRLDGLMAEVVLRIGDQELVSVITRSSAERLGLRVGDEVFAVIKSTEVMIGQGRTRSHEARRRARASWHRSLAALRAAAPRRARAPSSRRRVPVFAAASLADAFGEIGKRFEQRAPGRHRAPQPRGLAAARGPARAGRRRPTCSPRPTSAGWTRARAAGPRAGEPRAVRAQPAGRDRAAHEPGADRAGFRTWRGAASSS